MRKVVQSVVLACLLFLMSGCKTTGVVPIEYDLSCDPSQAIGVDGQTFNVHTTKTPDLACSLAGLRDLDHPDARQALNGAAVSAELSVRVPNNNFTERFSYECVDWAKKAAAFPGFEDEASYWHGLCLGNAVRNTPLKALRGLNQLEKTLLHAKETVPDIDEGGPLRVLGMLYIKAPAWPTGVGDSDLGLELLEEAVQKHPDHPLNHFFYAYALLDAAEDSEAATSELEIGLEKLEAPRFSEVAPYWKKEAISLAKELKIPLPE